MPDVEKSAKRKTYTIYAALLLMMVGIIAVSVVSAFHANTINDDTGWAIRNGWYLLTQGFHYRLTSSWVVNHPYQSTGPEWLTDGLLYVLYANTGWTGLVVLVQLALWSGMFLTYWHTKKNVQDNCHLRRHGGTRRCGTFSYVMVRSWITK